ncbi:MAG: hypothetical protein ABIQ93_06110, partial [Saprospiraceae bacterium]
MADPTTLTGSQQSIPLATGFSLQAPGLKGLSVKVEKPAPGTRSAIAVNPDEMRFSAALDKVGAQLSAHFEFTILADEPPPAPPVTARRAARALAPLPPATIKFAAPKPQAQTRSIVLHTDENGEMSWIWPHKTDAHKAYFNLPRPKAQPPQATETRERGAAIAGIRQVVKLITWATDDIVGDLAQYFAQKWEEKSRPYGFHYVQPGKFGGEVPWARMDEGRSLLLLHGTFSTGDGAFSGLIYSE